MTNGEQAVEARIEELVELERELQQPSGPVTDGVFEEGVIAGAERIPAEGVPEDYPVPIESEQALRIDVETDGGIVETYMEWAPHSKGESHVARLLEVLGRTPDEFASIFGDRVVLDYQDGHHGIDAEGTAQLNRTGTPALGVDLGFLENLEFQHSGKLVAGLVVLVAVGVEFAFIGGGDWTISLLLLTSLALPLAVGYDATRVRGEVEWDPVVPLWVVGAFVPFFNVPVATAYLFRRREKRRSLPGEVSPAWLYAVGLAGLTSFLALALFFIWTNASIAPWFFAGILLPVAVFFDFDYVETENYRNVKRVALTVVSAALSVVPFGFVAAAAYLYYRLR